MSTLFPKIALGAFFVSLVPMQSFGQSAMGVQYGRITEASKEELDSSGGAKKGAVIGGLAGAYSGRNKSGNTQRWRTVGGAAAGGIAGGAAAGGVIDSYIIELINGQTVKILIDRGSFAVGDCVAVEANSQSANLRRVSEQFCVADADIPEEFEEEHIREANECAAAKQAVVEATTQEEVNIAGMKMDILCQE